VVIKANGTVLPRSRVRDIERGDVIFVPNKAVILEDKVPWYRTLADVTQALGSLATTALVIRELNK